MMYNDKRRTSRGSLKEALIGLEGGNVGTFLR